MDSAKHILIAGDFIIDRTWLVTDLPLQKRHKSHYDIIPSTVVNPRNQTDVAGGVGTIARCIAATSDANITVATAWGDDIDDPRRLFPPDGKTDTARIDFISMARAPFTTLKLRVFTSEPDGPILRGRYDRNIKPEDLEAVDGKLPDASSISAVIVSDYDFGLLECGEISRKLSAYKGLPFILRSSSTALITALPWTILAVNLQHLARIVGRAEPFDTPIVQREGDHCFYHPEFVKGLESLHAKLPTKGRLVLVRISRNDAALVSPEKVTPITLSIAHNEPDGVGSGDILLAQLALALRDGASDQKAAADGFAASAVFSGTARQFEDIENWYTPRFDLNTGRTSVSQVEVKEESLDSLSNQEEKARTYNLLLRGPIRLRDANWYLPEFLTVNEPFGKGIVRLKTLIKKYVEDAKGGATPEHPFLAVLCGEPGAGKSTLARKIAKAVGCDVVSESAAQWTTAEDLFWLCERIRSIRMRKGFPLAFIDEVDTLVNNEKIYGKLLSPVWDGAYFIRGEERTLGPAVFILAGSTANWRTDQALLDAAREPEDPRDEKLPDLVSRLSATPINIPAVRDRREDVLYLAASSFVRRFPRVRGISTGILRMLAESECAHGVRSITRVAETFGPLSNDERVTAADLRANRYDELLMHIPRPLRDWNNDPSMEAIVPIEP